jgi:hypothetical protein
MTHARPGSTDDGVPRTYDRARNVSRPPPAPAVGDPRIRMTEATPFFPIVMKRIGD